MFHQLQPLLMVLGHRLIEFTSRLFMLPIQALTNNIDANVGRASFGDGLPFLDRLHWTPITGIVLGAASFVGFLLLVRYLQSATRPRLNRSAPRLVATPDLPAADIFVSVAATLIGLALCWATS